MTPWREIYRILFKRQYPVILVGHWQLFKEDARNLKTLLANVGDEPTIVELGAWCGQSSLVLGSAALRKDGHVFSIDTFDGAGSFLEEYAKTHNILEVFIKNMKSADLLDTVHPVVGRSVEVAKSFTDMSIDVLFVDADHRYSSVKADLEAWLPKVKLEGRVIGYDWDGPDWLEEHIEEDCAEYKGNKGYHHGVVKAVKEAMPDYKTLGRFWYWDKPI
jgi:predicted O-methyltransferase YrrM